MNDSKDQFTDVITKKTEELSQKVVERQYEKNPEYYPNFGEEEKIKSIQDVKYHLSFLTESLKLDDEQIFTDYVAWVKLLFREQKLPDSLMIQTLESMKEVLISRFSSEYNDQVQDFIDGGLKKMHESVEKPPSYITPENPQKELAKRFNTNLLQGNKRKASKLILDAVNQGASVKDIYLNVFQPSQLEIGRLWLLNEISVAQEHYVSAATQLIMSQLYSNIFGTQRNGKKFIGACIGDELHEIGIRMVVDFFEMEGWDTYYLGANTPVNTIILAVEDNHADALGLSIAMPYHRSLLKEAIDQIRTHFDNAVPKILIGGNGIKHNENIWKEFGADGYAKDAQEAVDLANILIENHGK